MIELFFVACLYTAPTACEERSVTFLTNGGLFGCMMQAPPRLAEWTTAHPNLRVARWSCRFADQKPQEA